MEINSNAPRITEADLAALKGMFLGRENAVEVLRKIFYPELTTDAPLYKNQDMWTYNFDLSEMTPEQKAVAIEARQQLIKHVEGSLSVIRALVGTKEETVDEALARIKKDSAK
jgi:hypothetical protein